VNQFLNWFTNTLDKIGARSIITTCCLKNGFRLKRQTDKNRMKYPPVLVRWVLWKKKGMKTLDKPEKAD
jgi:hypothetical protein